MKLRTNINKIILGNNSQDNLKQCRSYGENMGTDLPRINKKANFFFLLLKN